MNFYRVFRITGWIGSQHKSRNELHSQDKKPPSHIHHKNQKSLRRTHILRALLHKLSFYFWSLHDSNQFASFICMRKQIQQNTSNVTVAFYVFLNSLDDLRLTIYGLSASVIKFQKSTIWQHSPHKSADLRAFRTVKKTYSSTVRFFCLGRWSMRLRGNVGI